MEVVVIGRQWLRSGTSVAANYWEASRARSDAEFKWSSGIGGSYAETPRREGRPA
ncbi:MAG: four helix bundle protein [Verrucomicrobiae bacterium]|nr:four helix bundle protein [Verrucomicrobiae bacterium]